MYKKFIQAITWNSINIFLYKSILLIHQIILFHFVPKALYGASGMIFALVYLLIGITGFGFDYTLFTFFADYTKSQKSFKKLYQIFLNRFSILFCTSLLIWAATDYISTIPVLRFFLKNIPQNLLPYLLIIFFSESVKRSLESLAQLAFLNKKIMTIQVSMVTCYVILLWGSYFITNQITLHTIFMPMVIISATEILLLVSILHNYYKSLPQKSDLEIIDTTFSKSEQLYNYSNQLGKNLFSPNLLMLIITYNLGMQQAGSFRFFTNVITLLYMLLNRSIGVPSGALLSKINIQPLNKIREIFLTITNSYIQLLYVLGITIVATIVPRIIFHQPEGVIAYHVLFFIAAGFIEYIMLTYEKLYITQKAAYKLANINLLSIMLLSLYLVHGISLVPAQLLLLPICVVRIVTACTIGWYAYHAWLVRPSLSITYQTLLISVFSTIIINSLMLLYKYKPLLSFI